MDSGTRAAPRVRAALAVLATLALVGLLLASGRAAAQGTDGDLDGIPDAGDNCARVFNPDQEDHDDDGVGTTCDETKGVPADESTAILYLRDHNGRPVRSSCFMVTVLSASGGPSETHDVCGDDGQPGFALVRLDPGADARAEITQADLPPGCGGGLAGTHAHQTEAGKWDVVNVRYRCGTVANDADRDLISDGSDNCQALFNPDQEDADDDAVGNSCDPTAGIPEDESNVALYLRDQDGLALWDVCFELTEVRGEEPPEPADACVEESTPGYRVISLGAPEELRAEVAQIESVPGCGGGLRGKQIYAFVPGSWRVVDLRYTCGLPVTFTDPVTPSDRSQQHSIRVVKATRSIEFRLRWKSARDSFDVSAITFGDAARKLAAAGAEPAKLKITRVRTATSVLVRVQKLKPGKLKPGAPSIAEQLAFTVVGKKLRGSASVSTKVSQNRR